MSQRLVMLIALLLTAGSAAAQRSPQELVSDVFVRWDREDSPGMAVGVYHDGQALFELGFGMANLEHGIPIGPDTIFRIGSTSKQFTAMCIALLAQRGELDLDADIRTVLPELAAHDPPVTVRHLVHHVSGIPDYVRFHVEAGDELEDHVTFEDSLVLLARVATLDFPPGSRWAYSNSNYLLLGEIVRRVSGRTLREFAQENIFDPLGMEHTHYHDRHDEIVPGRADGYSPVEDRPGAWRIDNTRWEHVGDGGVFTTVRDLARWDANFDNNELGGGQELLDLVLTPGLLDDGTSHGYAFGLAVTEVGGRRMIQHSGGWVGFQAQMIRIPDERLLVIVLANSSTGEAPQRAMDVVQLLLGPSR